MIKVFWSQREIHQKWEYERHRRIRNWIKAKTEKGTIEVWTKILNWSRFCFFLVWFGDDIFFLYELLYTYTYENPTHNTHPLHIQTFAPIFVHDDDDDEETIKINETSNEHFSSQQTICACSIFHSRTIHESFAK